MPLLDPDDYQLSMKVSRKPKNAVDTVLRSLLLHRFTITMKAISRRALRAPRDTGFFCETCNRWYRVDGFPEVTQCPGCNSYYRIELAVYEQIDANNFRDTV
ncbi:MAG: hypothetical protein ABWX96_13635 [Propionibacteriaceae bacterium]